MESENRQAQCSKVSLWMTIGNLLLFVAYFVVGIISHSVAIFSEGIDNLTDACSALLLRLSFRIANRDKDTMHPNGHGRIEYISGLLISEMMLLSAFSLGKESVQRLLYPQGISSLGLLLAVSVLGAGIKLGLVFYTKAKNKKLKSPAIEAFHKNEIADLMGVVLTAIACLMQSLTSFPIDGVAGLAIAIMIAVDGMKSLLKNVSLLIGEGLTDQENEQVQQILSAYGNTIHLESLEVNDYGPGKKELILRIVPDRWMVYQEREFVDELKEKIQTETGIAASVYVNTAVPKKQSGGEWPVLARWERIRRSLGFVPQMREKRIAGRH